MRFVPHLLALGLVLGIGTSVAAVTGTFAIPPACASLSIEGVIRADGYCSHIAPQPKRTPTASAR